MKSNWDLFKDTGLFGNFLETHNALCWANQSVDPQSLYFVPCLLSIVLVVSNQLLFSNTMSFIFMADGIPIVYSGQEQLQL